MKFINTRTHAFADYALALCLFSAPRLFNLMDLDEAAGPAVWMLMPSVGFILFAVALITRYEGGAFKKIPIKIHLSIDLVLGLFLVGAPWLFKFSHVTFKPYLGVGIALVILSFFTSKTSPEQSGVSRRRPYRFGTDR